MACQIFPDKALRIQIGIGGGRIIIYLNTFRLTARGRVGVDASLLVGICQVSARGLFCGLGLTVGLL